jgi:hypothetical protein
MVNTVRPDEKSVMTYVSAYYHAFAGVYKVFKKRFAVGMRFFDLSFHFLELFPA